MKITIDRKSLVSALTTVKSVAKAKSELPILANVAIGTYEKSVDFTCTNMDQTIRFKADAVITGKGATAKDFTVRVNLFHDLVRSFTGENVDIETGKNSIDIRCGISKYHLGTLDIEEFPSTPRVSPTAEFKITQAFLRTLLTTTAYCAQTADDGRPLLCGSLFRVNGNLTAVGCDGRRLAIMSVPLDEKVKPMDVIVPRDTVTELLRLLENDEDKKLTMAIGEKNVQFQFGETTVISKIIDGKYPDYTKIIPKLEGDGVPVGRADLLNALRRVNFIDDKCSLEFRAMTLTVSAVSESKDVPGDAQESLLIPKSPEMTARFCTPYLIEALSCVDDDEVLFFGKTEGPGVFKVASKSWLSLTAPLLKKSESKPADKPAAKAPEPAKK